MKKTVMLAVFSLLIISVEAQIKVDSNNYIGIRTSTPTQRVEINSGQTRFYNSSNQPYSIGLWNSDPRMMSTNRIVFYKTDGSGWIDIQCGTLYENSDKAAKINITPLAGDNLGKIKKLSGVNFSWKNDRTKQLHAGLLAQDVEAVIPEAVMTNDSTQEKSLSYSALIPYLIEAIKEQQAEIDSLKKQVNQ